MSMDSEQPGEPDPWQPEEGKEGFGTHSQEVHTPQISARVPERVARGVFSTGAIVQQGANEFVLDFLLRMGAPHQICARVVLPIPVVPQFIQALRENLKQYQQRFGTPAMPPVPQPPPQNPTVQEIYEQLKLPDDILSGVYANAVMIGHTPTEFSFDFITTFFPRAAVACRVFLSAPNAPRLLDSLVNSFDQFRAKQAKQNPPPPPPPDPMP